MKIILLGDLHGNFALANYILKGTKELFKCDTIVQAGDFGIWASCLQAKSLKSILNIANNYKIYFVRGNHEEYIRNGKLYFSDYEGVIVPAFFKNVKNIPIHVDGDEFELDGKKWLGIGGAFSIDWMYRKVGVSWFPNHELVSETVYNRVMKDISTNKINPEIMITHEVPTSINIKMFELKPIMYNGKNKSGSDFLEKIYNAHPPKLWIHGHYHKAYANIDSRTGTLFVGLPMIEDGYAVFDTEKNEIEFMTIGHKVNKVFTGLV